ncbi:leucine-rich repeat protein [Mycoplasma sp. Pen4]|uniref:leucine-rich repeat protein n=1 Tax=Mycoplasma sp. Pen4 TaxID=640330 RepID=UPI001653FBB8|nr:leucine-rich repeat protein [Mycoplasma sp. Pen4]QNM93775.1 leucine-rich repeat protein [Mycoplasma sp. Pen4]
MKIRKKIATSLFLGTIAPLPLISISCTDKERESRVQELKDKLKELETEINQSNVLVSTVGDNVDIDLNTLKSKLETATKLATISTQDIEKIQEVKNKLFDLKQANTNLKLNIENYNKKKQELDELLKQLKQEILHANDLLNPVINAKDFNSNELKTKLTNSNNYLTQKLSITKIDEVNAAILDLQQINRKLVVDIQNYQVKKEELKTLLTNLETTVSESKKLFEPVKNETDLSTESFKEKLNAAKELLITDNLGIDKISDIKRIITELNESNTQLEKDIQNYNIKKEELKTLLTNLETTVNESKTLFEPVKNETDLSTESFKEKLNSAKELLTTENLSISKIGDIKRNIAELSESKTQLEKDIQDYNIKKTELKTLLTNLETTVSESKKLFEPVKNVTDISAENFKEKLNSAKELLAIENLSISRIGDIKRKIVELSESKTQLKKDIQDYNIKKAELDSLTPELENIFNSVSSKLEALKDLEQFQNPEVQLKLNAAKELLSAESLSVNKISDIKDLITYLTNADRKIKEGLDEFKNNIITGLDSLNTLNDDAKTYITNLVNDSSNNLGNLIEADKLSGLAKTMQNIYNGIKEQVFTVKREFESENTIISQNKQNELNPVVQKGRDLFTWSADNQTATIIPVAKEDLENKLREAITNALAIREEVQVVITYINEIRSFRNIYIEKTTNTIAESFRTNNEIAEQLYDQKQHPEKYFRTNISNTQLLELINPNLEWIYLPNVSIISRSALVPDSTSEMKVKYLIAPNLEAIPSGAFKDSNLQLIDAPKLKQIGQDAFKGSKLTNAFLNSIELINSDTFANLPLEKIDALNLKTIRDNAFSSTQLNEVNFPLLVTVGDNAFKDSTLKTIDAPMLETIGNNAFKSSQLLEVNLASLKFVGVEAFNNTPITRVITPNLITVSANAFANTGSLSHVELNSALEIKDFAFYNSSLDTIDAPKVKQVASKVFNKATNLTNVYFNEIEVIKDYLFKDIPLVKFVGPKVREIGYGAFSGTNLSDVDLPELELLHGRSDVAGVFQRSKIRTLNAPKLRTIGHDAFKSSGLTNANFPAAETVYNGAFSATTLENVIMPKVKRFYQSAFEDATFSNTELTFPELVQIDGGTCYFISGADPFYGAFQSTNITKIIAPKLQIIYSSAFAKSSLTEIDAPNVERIGDGAFCFTALKDVDFNKLKKIGRGVFYKTPNEDEILKKVSAIIENNKEQPNN